VSAGRKAQQFLARSKRNLIADFPMKDAPAFQDTKVVSKFCIDKFLSGDVDKVSVVFTHFLNTLVQKPLIRTILPISPFDLPGAGAGLGGDEANQSEYLYEPNAGEVLSGILPHYVHFQIYQMALDARASEHSARMVAMKSATDNAKQLISDLTLEYNKVRQASITTELLEIATAQIALG